MNELILKRHEFSDLSTIGDLILDGFFVGNTLEDTCRLAGVKLYGRTAIPSGRYRVMITESARFKRRLPLLLNVPGFEGIRIHPGNTDKDTLGCLLLGLYDPKHTDFIYQSHDTFEAFFKRLDALPGPFEILIQGGRKAA